VSRSDHFTVRVECIIVWAAFTFTLLASFAGPFHIVSRFTPLGAGYVQFSLPKEVLPHDHLCSDLNRPVVAVAAHRKARPATVLALLCTAALSAITLRRRRSSSPTPSAPSRAGELRRRTAALAPRAAPSRRPMPSADGCPATAVTIGTSLYGEGTDSFGNIFFLDTTNEILHRVDARSGIMTVLAGGATTVGCSGQADKFGDNCLAATQTGAFNNPRGLTIDPYGKRNHRRLQRRSRGDCLATRYRRSAPRARSATCESLPATLRAVLPVEPRPPA